MVKWADNREKSMAVKVENIKIMHLHSKYIHRKLILAIDLKQNNIWRQVPLMFRCRIERCNFFLKFFSSENFKICLFLILLMTCVFDWHKDVLYPGDRMLVRHSNEDSYLSQQQQQQQQQRPEERGQRSFCITFVLRTWLSSG